MNDRLEIASRLKMANASMGVWIDNESAIGDADALIAEEARTRPPAASNVSYSVHQWGPAAGQLPAAKDVPAPDAELRAVAEELYAALAVTDARVDDNIGCAAYEETMVRFGWNKIESGIRFERRLTTEALKRARALGLVHTDGNGEVVLATPPPAPAPLAPDAELRAVAEELYAACIVMARHGRSVDEQNKILMKYGWNPASRETSYWFEVNFAVQAIANARALGLGGGQ